MWKGGGLANAGCSPLDAKAEMKGSTESLRPAVSFNLLLASDASTQQNRVAEKVARASRMRPGPYGEH